METTTEPKESQQALAPPPIVYVYHSLAGIYFPSKSLFYSFYTYIRDCGFNYLVLLLSFIYTLLSVMLMKRRLAAIPYYFSRFFLSNLFERFLLLLTGWLIV